MKHTPLTLMILTLNHLLDTGRYDSITVDEVSEHIKDGSVLQFIRTRSEEDELGVLDVLLDGKTYGDFEHFFVTSLQSIQGGYGGQERQKWGVEHRGICLLIAWTAQILQDGTDWRPAPLAGVEPS